MGGYRSLQTGARNKASVYGKYVEPVLHGIEHTRRGITNDNQAEYGRAKDAFAATGKGLHNKDTKYQDSYPNENPKK